MRTTHELDCAGGVAVHAPGDGRGAAKLILLERVGRDLVERDDRHPPEKRQLYRRKHKTTGRRRAVETGE